MSFLGNYFVYNGISSKDFGLILVSINTGLNDIVSGSGIEIKSESVMKNPRKLFLGAKENTVLEFPIEIVSKEPIDLPTFLRIKNWLFGNPGYHKFQIEDEWYSDFYFNCILKANEDIKFGGEYFGVRCNVECDSPYAYTFPQTKIYNFDSSVINYFEFDNFSSEVYGLRPTIELKLSSAGNNFNIKNLTTKREFKMENLSTNEVITVDNQNEIITSSTGLNRFKNLSKGQSQGYFSLVHGINKLECHGLLDYLKITYQFAVRLGCG